MSTGHQTPSTSTTNFTEIFETALDQYKKLTGQDIQTHPHAAAFDDCDSPDAVLNVFRKEAEAFEKINNGNDKLLGWLGPVVHVLFTFSATLGEGIGLPFSPAKTIFTGIGVLLGAVRDIVASHDKILHVFERINFFLQRLNIYIGIPLTNELTVLLGKIMAQLLCVLALSTKTMTERRMKKFLKRFVGRTDVEDALERLDAVTKEETPMTVARNLEVTHHVDNNVEEMKGVIHDVDHNVKATRDVTDELNRNQLQEKLRVWLSPPDPSVNHNLACKTHHDGTATWFTLGNTFQEWKKNGSLLWIRGNPGAGKSILSSAIVEDVKSMRDVRSALVGYYYFDYKDISKRNVRGLLASLLLQLTDDSNSCWDVLCQLYKSCHDGSEQPSDAALAKCLKTMLELPKQLPIFVIMDALDECPNTIGTPSARDEVLDFVEDLMLSGHPNLFICITSRPEHDIQSVFTPLTSPSTRVALHEEQGQREDINNYVRSFVYADRTMRRWREDDKELVIRTLSERAQGMFRWAFCQLDTLRRCMPSSIRKTLNELPTTLDDTYERALQGIPKEKLQHAHHLFLCLIAAIRPLHVEELAEIFAINFDADSGSNLMVDWRPDNPEEAILSTCSTLIVVIENEDKRSKIVQFSHFSVKEFLTSDRLRTSDIENIRIYYIPLDFAHTVLVRACLTVLLQLDGSVDKERLDGFPLASYAAQHWVDHAKFKDVETRIQDDMERLFDPRNTYLASWIWIHDVDNGWTRSIDDLPEHPSQPEGTALYYAVSCGFSGLANYLIHTHAEDVNGMSGYQGTPLHAASYWGQVDAVRLLLDHGADVNTKNEREKTPLFSACDGGHLEVMRLLIEHGSDVDTICPAGTLLKEASERGQVDIVRLLLQHNVNIEDNRGGSNWLGWTPLHRASFGGHPKVAEVLLEHGAKVNALSKSHDTPLFVASDYGKLEVARVLLEHGADVHIRGEHNQTPFQKATSNDHTELAQLLLEFGAQKE